MFEYNYIEIGDRIRNERKKLGLSQEDLLENIREKNKPCFGRNTLSRLENGDPEAFNAISISQFTALCEEFQCSISFLMGEYISRNYDNNFIYEKIGLNDKSIETLCSVKSISSGKELLNIINQLFSIPDFSFNLIDKIRICITKSQQYCRAKKLNDELYEDSKGDILKILELLDTQKYKNALTKDKIEELYNSKESIFYRTQIHFTQILNNLINQDNK